MNRAVSKDRAELATSIRAAMAYAPSNLLVSRLRARGGLGSALTAITVGAAYLFAAGICTGRSCSS